MEFGHIVSEISDILINYYIFISYIKAVSHLQLCCCTKCRHDCATWPDVLMLFTTSTLLLHWAEPQNIYMEGSSRVATMSITSFRSFSLAEFPATSQFSLSHDRYHLGSVKVNVCILRTPAHAVSLGLLLCHLRLAALCQLHSSLACPDFRSFWNVKKAKMKSGCEYCCHILLSYIVVIYNQYFPDLGTISWFWKIVFTQLH